MKTIEENNRLIAEFMVGYPITFHHNQYHVSWNELMPVVRELKSRNIPIGVDTTDGLLTGDIEKAFIGIISTIEWYNEQK